MILRLKSIRFITVLLFTTMLYANCFSQEQPYEEHVFTYKVVEGHEIKANIFLPDSEQRVPVVVYFHGGGFIFGNRDAGLVDVLKDVLLSNGYAVVSADYRLAPETKLAEIINDARDAIAWLRTKGINKFNIDADKIAVAGGSAAGYLALSTGYNNAPPPNAIIAISSPTGFTTANIQKGDEAVLQSPSPYDIVKDTAVSYGDYSSRMELWRFLARNRLALFEIFGFDVSKEPSRLQKYTLTENIKAGFPPTLLVYAKNDRLVNLSEAEQLESFLKKKNIESELFVVENGHSSELIRGNPHAVVKIIQFLNAHMK